MAVPRSMLEVEAAATLGDLDLDLALRVEPSECLALAGPSGAGKSSLLRVVAGLLRPERGIVRCASETWLDTATGIDLPPERRRTGFLFQDYALFDHMTAAANVAYGMRHVPRSERAAAAHALLDRFGLANRATATPPTLSGGERQRVALARALARSPQALLLDEPLSALDATTRARAGRELAELIAAAGVPTVLVTHSFEEAALLATRAAVIDHGRLVQTGTAAELAAAPASAFVADLTGAVVLAGTAERDGNLTAVTLDGGGRLYSTDSATGPVAATVHPWEIALHRSEAPPEGSPRNTLDVEITAVTTLGNRARVGLMASQPLTAELTVEAAAALALEPGSRAIASFKATATRLVPR